MVERAEKARLGKVAWAGSTAGEDGCNSRKGQEKFASSQECASERVVAENNSIGDIAAALAAGKSLEQRAEEYVEAENERYRKENCAGITAEACTVKMYSQRREDLKTILLTGTDFVPVVGTN